MPISKWADTEPDLQNEDFQTLVKLKLKRSILTGAFLLTLYHHTHSDQSRQRILFSAFLNNQSVCLFRDNTSDAFLESHAKQFCSSDTFVQTQQFILLLLARFLPLLIWNPSTYLPVETGLEQTITSVNKMEKHFVQYFFLFLFLAHRLDVQRQRPDHSLPWGKPDTRQATADVTSHETSGEFLWCHIPLLTALKWWRGRERLTTEGAVVWKGETVVAGGRGVDEKKSWCLSSAALLFSLMFPLLSAVGAVSSNHTHSERLWRW